MREFPANTRLVSRKNAKKQTLPIFTIVSVYFDRKRGLLWVIITHNHKSQEKEFRQRLPKTEERVILTRSTTMKNTERLNHRVSPSMGISGVYT